jgi:hypothetical protein
MRPGAVTAVAIRDPAGGRVCARLPGWPMHDGEVEIVVPEAARPSAFVTGRICDVEGAPLLAARVHALRAGDPAVHGAAVDPGGAFRIGPLPPDVYRLAVEAPGQPGMELATVALAPGAEHAVGTLVLARRNP